VINNYIGHSCLGQKLRFFGGGTKNICPNIFHFMKNHGFNFQIPLAKFKVFPGERACHLKKVLTGKSGLNCQRACPNNFKFGPKLRGLGCHEKVNICGKDGDSSFPLENCYCGLRAVKFIKKSFIIPARGVY